MRNPTKAEAAAADLGALLDAAHVETARAAAEAGGVPDAWREVWQAREAPARDHVSLRVDRDVVRFFRSLGPGYGGRMNRVLRAFVLAQVAGYVRGPALPEAWRAAWMDRPPEAEPGWVSVPRDTLHGLLQAAGGYVRSAAAGGYAETPDMPDDGTVPTLPVLREGEVPVPTRTMEETLAAANALGRIVDAALAVMTEAQKAEVEKVVGV